MKHLLLFFFLLLSACTTDKPIEDMAIADLAVKAALKSKADIHATELYRRAENYFLRAKRDFNESYYESAKKYANIARLTAEQAEYRSVLKQNQIRTKASEEPPVTVPDEKSNPLNGITTEKLD